jgi:tetratricopeptide (TPR) repeat protein
VAASLHNLGALLDDEGRCEEAALTFREALRIRERVHGSRDHYQAAETQVYLATVLLKLGQSQEAHHLLAQALGVLRRQLPGHPLIAQLRPFLEPGMRGE